MKQHTLAREVSCAGVGLHSGAQVSMTLKPAPADYGIRFRRIDLRDHPIIVAHHHHVVDTFLATSIGSNGVVVSTIEHLMAAFLGSGVDNAMVELDSAEVPIFDGSAAPYLTVIQEAGLIEQDAPRQCLVVERPIVVREADSYIKATPSERFRVRYGIDFPHPLVGRQEFTWSFNPLTFGRDVARARTFGFLKDVQKLQSMGLAKGGSLENAVVFDEYGLLNQDGFRYADECVRHKLLDFMGDIALTGMPLYGDFEVYKAGHALHSRFLKQLVAKPGYCSVMTPASIPTPFFASPALPGFADSFQMAVKSL